MWDEYWEDRGSPWEHDPGPAKNRRWSRLFAETPNYRGFGKAMSGSEEFRWHFGPMFYRGRLGDNQVKVLIVGQEGAQDESLSHRSFTGGTGARMQRLLNHLGIDRSYLFLNTFVYPIFDQYNGLLPTIAQHPASPIARPPDRDPRLRRRAQRSPTGDRRRARRQGIDGELGEGARRHRRRREAPPRRRLGDLAQPQDGRRAASGWRRTGRRGRGDHRQLQGRDHQGPRVGRRRSRRGSRSTPVRRGAAPRRTRTPPTRSRSVTSPTARRGGSAAAAPPRTDATTSAASRSSPSTASTTTTGTRCRTRAASRAPRPATTRRAGDLAWEPPRQAHADFDRGPGTKFAAAAAGRPRRVRVAGLQVVRAEVRGVVRHRADLQGPPRQAEHPGARRPGVARRPVHDAGVERRCRPTPAGVPHRGRRHQAVRHPARPPRRHARRRPIARRSRRRLARASVRSTPRRCADPSPRSCCSSVRSPSACAPT